MAISTTRIRSSGSVEWVPPLLTTTHRCSMIFASGEGGAHVWTWGARVGYSWRMADDSTPTSEYIKSIMSINVAHLSSVDFFSHNDMDMMEIGNGNLTIEEERTHLAVWALMKSPILLGTDPAAPSPEEVETIRNAELIAFLQDTTEGKPALPFTPPDSISTDPPQSYSGGSAKGIHVFIVNTNDEPTTFKLDFVDVLGLNSSSAGVHDMWTLTNMGIFSTSFNVALAVHDIAALLVTPVSQKQSVSNDNGLPFRLGHCQELPLHFVHTYDSRTI